jgi:hypothetical protein
LQVRLPRLQAWRVAEHEVELASRRWRTALRFIHDDSFIAFDLKIALAERRVEAHELFLLAMDECKAVAASLHFRNLTQQEWVE